MSREKLERWALRVVGIAGLTLFGAFFTFTYSMPQSVERFGAEYITGEVGRKIDSTIDAVRAPAGTGLLHRAAADLYARNESEIESLKATAKERAHELMDASLAQVRDPACDCRRVVVQGIDLGRIAQLLRDNRRVSEFIHGTYMKVRNDLAHEIRIFTATNALCFLLVVLVSFAKPAAARHLFFPAVLLVVSSGFCAWLYVFSQDWLLTIIQGSYVGYAYAAWLGVVFLFVCDIGLNRGRVTAHVVNGASATLGSAFSLVPC